MSHFSTRTPTGVKDAGEAQPVPGATIFADLNNNGSVDVDEPQATPDLGGGWSLSLEPAQYVIRAAWPAGYTQSLPLNGAGRTVTVRAGFNQFGVDFGAWSLAKIGGYLWNDLNKNLEPDTSEPRIGGRTVYVDLDQDGALDPGEPTTLSESQPSNNPGFFSFDLKPGTYRIRQVLTAGWVQTFPSIGYTQVTAVSGQVNVPQGIGSYARRAYITGAVFNDLNASGALGSGEPFIAGRTV